MKFLNAIAPAAKEVVVPAFMKRLEDKDRWPTQFVPLYNSLLKLGVEEEKLLPAVIAVLEDSVSPESKYPIKGDRSQPFQLVGFDLIKKLGKDAGPAGESVGEELDLAAHGGDVAVPGAGQADGLPMAAPGGERAVQEGVSLAERGQQPVVVLLRNRRESWRHRGRYSSAR
jgi:hypothetical protein